MKLKLKKGLNLNIAGGLNSDTQIIDLNVGLYAIVPDDFPGFVPKASVHDGDEVAVGTPLLFDKNHPEVKLVSPVAGRVRSVVRGERRKIMRVEVEASDTAVESPELPKPTDKKSACSFLAESGLLAMLRQRPYDIVPNPDDSVRDIFVTALDTAPLAAPASVYSSIFGKEDYEEGVKVLRLISNGKVYISHGADFATVVPMVKFDYKKRLQATQGYWPIPQDEIDISNGVLEQNPGWDASAQFSDWNNM